MPRHVPPTATVASRLSRIKDVADDLTRELVRVRGGATLGLAVRDMAAFIKTEAEAALRALPSSRVQTGR